MSISDELREKIDDATAQLTIALAYRCPPGSNVEQTFGKELRAYRAAMIDLGIETALSDMVPAQRCAYCGQLDGQGEHKENRTTLASHSFHAYARPRV